MDVVFLTNDQKVVGIKREQDILSLIGSINFERELKGNGDKGRVKVDGQLYTISSFEVYSFTKDKNSDIKSGIVSQLYKDDKIGDNVAVFWIVIQN